VIDVQRTLAYAEQTLAQLESAISDDQVAVFLALGGGWDVAEDHAEVAQAGASGRRGPDTCQLSTRNRGTSRPMPSLMCGRLRSQEPPVGGGGRGVAAILR
jgi:hypothetical protein